MTDAELLQTFARTRADDAFRALIDRYLNLVYSACFRQLRDAHLAQDAVQAVFLLLSQRASSVRPERLSSWLLTVSRYTCANLRKTELRRAQREKVVAMLRTKNASNDDELLAHLDAALARLRDVDRQAVALRYLQDRSLEDISRALGISEEAARKRIDRAILKLRSYFVRHGLAATPAGIAVLLPSHASASALSAGLHATFANSILQSCHAGAVSPAFALAKGVKVMMLTHTLKTTGAGLAVAAILLGGTWLAIRTAPGQVAPERATATPAAKADLSTPDKAMDAFVRAIKDGDRAALDACLLPAPGRASSAGDGFLSMNLAQNHLIHAAAKAFGTSGEEARMFPTLDVILEQLLAWNRAQNRPAAITGDTASITLNIPDRILSTFPESVQKQVRSFNDRPIHLARHDSQWLLGPSISEVDISLTGTNEQRINDAKTEIAFMKEYTANIQRLADDISAGHYANWDTAKSTLISDNEVLHKRYNVADFNVTLKPIADQTKPEP